MVKQLDPIFSTLAPGVGDIPRTPGREKLDGTAEQGYLHCGPNGAGHFVKMVHNGIEYGIMAAYAEGLGILRDANVGKHTPEPSTRRPRRCAIRNIYQYDLEFARHRGSMAARQRDRLVAAGFDGRQPGEGSGAFAICGPRLGFGRGPLDDQGGHRRSRARCRFSPRRSIERFASRGEADYQDRLLSAMRFGFGGHLEKAAGQVTARGKEICHESTRNSDALVFFGATGDLAYKKIFPALQAMIKRGHLNVPVIGVAKDGWNLDQLRAQGSATASKSTAESIQRRSRS